MKYLIVVDMQNDFISGSLGSDAAKSIVSNVAKKIEQYRNDPDAKIIFTSDTHQEDYLDTLEGKMLPVKHCIQDTLGWLISDDLPYENDDLFIYKETFGYIHWGQIIKAISGDTIEIVGLCTDICVVSNALILRAIFPNVDMICDSNCCAGTTTDKHLAALDVMRSCQIQVV